MKVKSSNSRGVFINSKISKKISRRQIFGCEHLVIEGGGSIIGNSVMNGILYPLDEVKKLASESTSFIHAPNSHPYDDNGAFISAGSPEAVSKFYIGGVAYNYRMSGDRLVRDIAINVEVASRTEPGKELIRRIEAGEDIDTSTGLLYKPEVVSGIGQDGEPYEAVARDMKLDHDALLMHEVGAATSDQGVGLFANSAGEDEEVAISTVAINASMPALRLEVVDIEWDEPGALQRIKEYTGSVESPSSNYRRFFLEFDRDKVDSFDSYSKLFADILDGKPVAVKKAIEKYAAEKLDGRAAMAIKVYATNSLANSAVKEPGAMRTLFTKFMEWFAINKDCEYTTNANANNSEDNAMKEMINAYLNKAGVNTEGMTDEQMLNAYMNEMAKANKAKNEEDEAAKLAAEEAAAKEAAAASAGGGSDAATNKLLSTLLTTVNTLATEVKDLRVATNAGKEAELNELAAQVEALDIGLNSASAKVLGADSMKALIAKNGGVVNFNVNSAQFAGRGNGLDDGTSGFMAK